MNPEVVTPENFLHDHFAQKVIDTYYPNENFKAVNVFGEGNCFPRSLAKALHGDENAYFEIKTRNTLGMIKYREKVLQMIKERETLPELGGSSWGGEDLDYDSEIRKCITDGEYAGPYQFASAALVFKLKLNMHFPPHNGRSEPILGGLFF